METAIDNDLSAISNILLNTAIENMPVKKFHPHQIPKWGDKLSQAQKTSKAAFNMWKKGGKPRDPSNPLWSNYKSCKGKFRSDLRHHTKDLLNAFLDNLDASDTDQKKLFNNIRRYLGKSHTPTTKLLVNGEKFTSENIIEGWTLHYTKLFSPSADSSFCRNTESSVATQMEEILANLNKNSDFLVFSDDDVCMAIKSLSMGKAPGPDGIEPEHIRHAGEPLVTHLTLLFNAIANQGYIPKQFRVGLLIPILKGPNKDHRDPGNYRGISLLSNFAKLFEKLILTRLTLIVQLNPLQGGFRPGLSCTHTSFILQEAICSIREQKKKAFVAFLDAQKAFDTVWHAGLLTKLHEKGVTGKIWRLIYHWYSSSSTSILWEGEMSSPVPILQGVRQGAILSPLLYSVFVDGLLDILSINQRGAVIGDVFIGSPMYADDLALIADNASSLQAMINTVQIYACA